MSSVDIIAIKYAKALFDAAVEAKVTETVYKDLVKIADILHEDQTYSRHLLSKSLPIAIKQKLFESKFAKLKLNKITNNVVKALIQNKQMFCFKQFVKHYSSHIKRQIGTLVVEVVTAVELTQANKKKVMNQLASSLNNDKLEIKWQVEPNIIGGLIIKYGSNIVDLSISNKLNSIKKHLISN